MPWVDFPVMVKGRSRHCEEHRDEAIQDRTRSLSLALDCLASLAMTEMSIRALD
jgi:hypothetical protein